MPFDSEFHVSFQRLILALIFILVPITIFGLYIGLEASHQVQQMNGAYFRSIAQGSAAIISQYVGAGTADVVQIANLPSVQQAVMSANRAYENVSDSTIRAKADQIEARWNNAESDPLVKNILGSDVARSIRRYRELNPKLLRIQVIDQAGGTVAATDKPLQYFQTESEYWRVLTSKAQIKTYVSEVHYDEQTRTQYISVSSPVYQEGSGRFIGAVTAQLDVSPLFSYVNQQQIARTGHVFLINEEGTVISAPGIAPSDRVKSEEYTAIHDALGTLHGRETGYLQGTLRNGETYLIGFADTMLKAAYPNLPWLVVVSQDIREAEGPVRNMVFFAMLMTVICLVLISVLGAYSFLHRRQRLQDLEEEQPEEEPQEEKRAASV